MLSLPYPRLPYSEQRPLIAPMNAGGDGRQSVHLILPAAPIASLCGGLLNVIPLYPWQASICTTACLVFPAWSLERKKDVARGRCPG